MKIVLLTALLVALAVADVGADVVIWMGYPSEPTVCPSPPRPRPKRVVTESLDYYEAPGPVLTIHSIACWTPIRMVREVWTRRPEDGGWFLREAGPDE